MKRARQVLKTLRDVHYLTTMGDGGTGIDLLYAFTAYFTVRYLFWSNPWWGDGTMVGQLTIIMLVLLALTTLLVVWGYVEVKRRSKPKKQVPLHDEAYSYGEHLPQRK